MSQPAVRMRGIRKSFGRVPVLSDVDFELRPGEVHALLGENGAGKSTLMKILTGVHAPDAGELTVEGEPARFHSPHDAAARGIAMVFQEFSVIPTLSVAQNIFLTREPRGRLGMLDDREAERRAAALFAELGVQVDPRTTVSRLSTGYRQLTEIAAAIAKDARILILDEPTASLTHTETVALFSLIRRLKERGISVVYISHRMEEIFQIADRVTVLRNGRHVVTEEVARTTIQEVIEHIIGRKAGSALRFQPHAVDRTGPPLLEARGLTCDAGGSGVSFRLYAGEVLGLAGLMGSGRTELVQALFGIRPVRSGEIRIHGHATRIRRPADAMAARIALIPEDRRLQGLVLAHSVRANLHLPLLRLGRLTRPSGLVDERATDELAEGFVRKLSIRVGSILKPVRLLSGGNQQKVVIGKWLSTEPEILLMDEPTAGVDIGTKAEIIEMVRQLAREGKGVIMVSSELPELLAVADRILVLEKGRVSREMYRSEIDSEEQLNQIIQGVHD